MHLYFSFAAIWIVTFPATVDAGEPASEEIVFTAKRTGDQFTTFIGTQNDELREKEKALVELGKRANASTLASQTSDTNSVNRAVTELVDYAAGIREFEKAAKTHGEYIEYVGKVFRAVKAKEDSGELPTGTISVSQLDALDSCMVRLDIATQTTVIRRSDWGSLADHLTRKTGTHVRDIGEGVPVGLAIEAAYLPNSPSTPVNVPQGGFILVVNHNREMPIPGRLSIQVDQAEGDYTILLECDDGAKPSCEFTIPVGGAKKFDFSVTIHQAGGRFVYRPLLEEGNFKRP